MQDFLGTMKAKAAANKKTIVLPEGEDPRTLEAAAQIIDEDLANLVILNNTGVPIDMPGATIIDPRPSTRSMPKSSGACAPRRA